VAGEIVGVWRRSAAEVSIDAWRRLSSAEREAIEADENDTVGQSSAR